MKTQFQNQVSQYVETLTNEVLSKTEYYLLESSEKPSEEQRNNYKARIQTLFNKIIHENLMNYIKNTKHSGTELVLHGQKFVLTNMMPLYMKIKATVLVSK